MSTIVPERHCGIASTNLVNEILRWRPRRSKTRSDVARSRIPHIRAVITNTRPDGRRSRYSHICAEISNLRTSVRILQDPYRRADIPNCDPMGRCSQYPHIRAYSLNPDQTRNSPESRTSVRLLPHIAHLWTTLPNIAHPCGSWTPGQIDAHPYWHSKYSHICAKFRRGKTPAHPCECSSVY